MMTRMQVNPMVIAVVATDQRGAIGRGMDIPWKCSDDLKRFRKITTGQAVIMGYKTALSMGRALPNRCNIVLSRHAEEAPFPGQHLVRTVEEAMACAKMHIMAEDDRLAYPCVYVIGGGEIYTLFVPYYHGLHLTTIQRTVEDADIFFPVDLFLQTHGASNRLFYVKGDRSPVRDGDEMTTYAYYEIHPESSPRMDPVTQAHLPWCTTPAARPAPVTDEEE